MEFNIEAVPAEDIEPLAKAMTLLPPERRGEVYFRIQNAAREFLAKAAAGSPPASADQTDPIRKAVFGALEKQLPAPPAPAPTLDPLKREALGTLEKAVLAGARAARGEFKSAYAGSLAASKKDARAVGRSTARLAHAEFIKRGYFSTVGGAGVAAGGINAAAARPRRQKDQ